ncbi:hypothetical protein [Amycolatopsis australiensis]|nr:hypothetical protein [Amycolatopsis australiensis]
MLATFTRIRTSCFDIESWAADDATSAEWAVASPVRRNDSGGIARQ